METKENHPIVPPSGKTKGSKLIIVGARPGYQEAKRGTPFIGPSGDLLFRLLPLDRSECYVTNVRRDFHPARPLPSASELKEALPFLQKELEETDCQVILTLGNEATYALTGKYGIDKLRGSILPSTLLPGRRVLAAWHPANILRTYERVYTLEHDLRRACFLAQNPTLKLPERSYLLAPPFPHAVELLRSLGRKVVVDIECPRYDQDVIYCLGLSDSSHQAFTIPFVGGFYNLSELEVLFREIDTVLRTREIVGQNVMFDVSRLERLGFEVTNVSSDTMLKHHLLWPEAGLKRKDELGKDNFSGGHSLAFLTSIYTLEPYYKDEGEMEFLDGKLNWPKYLTYNCKDVAITYECDEKLDEELREFNQASYYQEHVNGLLRPISRMQQRGLLVDTAKLAEIRERLNLEARAYQGRLERELGYRINVKSTDDKRWLLYDYLGFKGDKKTKGGSYSTDEETIRQLAYNNPHRKLLNLLLDTIETRTLLSGFLSLQPDNDGRYRASYLIHGTDSGRLSSRAIAGRDGGKGPQLQNIPKSIRKIFRAPEGYKIVQADLSKAEAMFVAYDSQDEKLIEVFEKGIDLYCDWASEVLQRTITKGMPERDAFKQGAHANHYGIGPLRYIRTLRKQGIDIEDLQILNITQPLRKAEFILSSYLQRFKGIKRWQREIINEVSSTRTLYDIFGRRRFFMGRLNDIHRIAFSYKPQATVVGITNQAIRRLDKEGWEVILQVHDSVGVECPTSRLEECYASLRKAFYHPITLHDRTFNIPIDISVGDNWGEVKEI